MFSKDLSCVSGCALWRLVWPATCPSSLHSALLLSLQLAYSADMMMAAGVSYEETLLQDRTLTGETEDSKHLIIFYDKKLCQYFKGFLEYTSAEKSETSLTSFH